MHPRITISCALLALVLTGSTGSAHAVDCQSDKGSGYPWSWRLIDGKRCWYKGNPGMDKKLLRWAENTPAPAPAARARRPSATSENAAERENLLHSYWPLLPQADVFGDRFEAVRAKRP